MLSNVPSEQSQGQLEYCFHLLHAAFYETKAGPNFYLLPLTYIFLQQRIFGMELNCSQKSLFSFSLFNKRDFEVKTSVLIFTAVVCTAAT